MTDRVIPFDSNIFDVTEITEPTANLLGNKIPARVEAEVEEEGGGLVRTCMCVFLRLRVATQQITPPLPVKPCPVGVKPEKKKQMWVPGDITLQELLLPRSAVEFVLGASCQ